MTNDEGSSWRGWPITTILARGQGRERRGDQDLHSLPARPLLIEALSGEDAPSAEAMRLPDGAREVVGCRWEGTSRYPLRRPHGRDVAGVQPAHRPRRQPSS